MRWAFRLPVKGPRKSVLVALADHCGDSLVCWPSAARLALWAGCSERAARDAIHELARLGHVEITVREGQTFKYRLLVPDQLPPPPIDDDHEHPGTSRADPGTSRTSPRNLTPEPRNQVPTNHLEAPKEYPREADVRATAVPLAEPTRLSLWEARNPPKPKPVVSPQFSLIPPDRLDKSGLVNGKRDAFEKFWELYPFQLVSKKLVKRGKDTAAIEFAKAIKVHPPEFIIAALKAHPFPSDLKYVKNPTDWLREKRYNNEVKELPEEQTDPFAALHRMQAEHARNSADDVFAGPTIDAEMEEYPHG